LAKTGGKIPVREDLVSARPVKQRAIDLAKEISVEPGAPL